MSDTATRPSEGMWDAMRQAPLGDEQRREDPTTLALEERMANLLGFECALLLPTATMANQIAIALQTSAGDEVLTDKDSHIVHYEAGYTSVIARAQLSLLDGKSGIFTAQQVRDAIRPDDPHFPDAALVVVENTANRAGGNPWPLHQWDEIAQVSKELGLALHIDGARLFNACLAEGQTPKRLVRGATTVQVCFSKGLGCPFGAILAMPKSLWRRARQLKQGLGGALRQSGVIAAAMNFALDAQLDALKDDHRRAEILQQALRQHEGIHVPESKTNLVYFESAAGHPFAEAFCQALLEHGVRMGAVSPTRVRACLHRDISDADLDKALWATQQLLNEHQRLGSKAEF